MTGSRLLKNVGCALLCAAGGTSKVERPSYEDTAERQLPHARQSLRGIPVAPLILPLTISFQRPLGALLESGILRSDVDNRRISDITAATLVSTPNLLSRLGLSVREDAKTSGKLP
jgi:hypothetical protein